MKKTKLHRLLSLALVLTLLAAFTCSASAMGGPVECFY